MKKNYVEKIVIRFVGDSGDGIQLIGNQFSDSSVLISGNDIYTFVDFPAEIRAPAGSLSGVSGFQLSISSKKLYTVEDTIDILVAFNPAALKSSIKLLKHGGTLIIDIDSFNNKNIKRAGYTISPVLDTSLEIFNVIKAPVTKLTCECVKDIISSVSKAKRCKNFFVLGLISWIFDRDTQNIIDWLSIKFKNSNILYEANKNALLAGFNYGNTLEVSQSKIIIPSVNFLSKNDKLIKMSGNKAFSLGAMSTSHLLTTPLFSANYPITPASEVLHELSSFISNDFKIYQLEDEIASINAVIGASYGGFLSFTCTSGPGLDLMQEGIGLACMAEIPIVILNVQRCGPSTGIPTKSEQTDLLSSMFGSHGETHIIILAPNSPSDCYWSIIEGFLLSIIYSGPVIILSDANLANSFELFKIPLFNDIKNKYKTILNITQTKINNRNKLSPGNKDSQKCIGGLEKDHLSGNISHDPDNHNTMTLKRQKKFNDITQYYTKLNIIGKSKNTVLLLTWGSVYGIVRTAYNHLTNNYSSISLLCLRYINPLPMDLKNILLSFKKILIIEENLGQLYFILKSHYLIDFILINQVSGKPFKLNELKNKIEKYVK